MTPNIVSPGPTAWPPTHNNENFIFFLTPRGNVLPSVSAARRPAKGYFRAVVPQLPSRRLHCTPLIASLPKVFLDQTAEMAQVLFKA